MAASLKPIVDNEVNEVAVDSAVNCDHLVSGNDVLQSAVKVSELMILAMNCSSVALIYSAVSPMLASTESTAASWAFSRP